MGVTRIGENKYRARIARNGKRYSLGVFDTELKAKRALSKKRKELEGHQTSFGIYFDEAGTIPLADVAKLKVDTNVAQFWSTKEEMSIKKPSLLDRIRGKIGSWRNQQ